MDYALGLPINLITNLLANAWNKEDESRAWDIYLKAYSNMTQETFISFEEFIKPKKKHKVEVKSEKEILEEVKGILDSWGGERHRTI